MELWSRGMHIYCDKVFEQKKQYYTNLYEQTQAADAQARLRAQVHSSGPQYDESVTTNANAIEKQKDSSELNMDNKKSTLQRRASLTTSFNTMFSNNGSGVASGLSGNSLMSNVWSGLNGVGSTTPPKKYESQSGGTNGSNSIVTMEYIESMVPTVIYIDDLISATDIILKKPLKILFSLHVSSACAW